jgi:hypothetical protein
LETLANTNDTDDNNSTWLSGKLEKVKIVIESAISKKSSVYITYSRKETPDKKNKLERGQKQETATPIDTFRQIDSQGFKEGVRD